MKEVIKPDRLASALRTYRKLHNMSLGELAKKLDIPRWTIARWELGMVCISPMMYKHLVREGVIQEKRAGV